ncbi:hypothetical protein M438DRAFT_23681 [Aureobasidium pullulans EXF-150]|uniref:Uncharacterized protein n=1 Tax=Aureobasidium pullulans EXF-150 TaxID=1043002 RepID=A0A074XJG5_AURPU|nr:uncharacterized protein M438DRAFT_23681 [Aureobasidium pullulans EXF-150]KEQ83849.1 hypothetical protein M438DRAFT_23681 [Aureobasidium pullulans EXF-150]
MCRSLSFRNAGVSYLHYSSTFPVALFGNKVFILLVVDDAPYRYKLIKASRKLGVDCRSKPENQHFMEMLDDEGLSAI